MPDIVPNLYTSKGCVQTTNRGQDAYKIVGRASAAWNDGSDFDFFALCHTICKKKQSYLINT